MRACVVLRSPTSTTTLAERVGLIYEDRPLDAFSGLSSQGTEMASVNLTCATSPTDAGHPHRPTDRNIS